MKRHLEKQMDHVEAAAWAVLAPTLTAAITRAQAATGNTTGSQAGPGAPLMPQGDLLGTDWGSHRNFLQIFYRLRSKHVKDRPFIDCASISKRKDVASLQPYFFTPPKLLCAPPRRRT